MRFIYRLSARVHQTIIQQITGQEDWMRLTNDIARNENSSQGLH